MLSFKQLGTTLIFLCEVVCVLPYTRAAPTNLVSEADFLKKLEQEQEVGPPGAASIPSPPSGGRVFYSPRALQETRGGFELLHASQLKRAGI